MTKEIAVLHMEQLDDLLGALAGLGYTFENPYNGEISGYQGDRIVFESVKCARAFMVAGRGLVHLWARDGGLAVTTTDGQLRVFFDGFCESESDSIMKHLSAHDLAFCVDYDV